MGRPTKASVVVYYRHKNEPKVSCNWEDSSVLVDVPKGFELKMEKEDDVRLTLTSEKNILSILELG